MNKTQLKTVIRELLSSDKDSYVIGDKYKNTFLNKRQEYINALLKNKKNLVKRYGKDAEKVLGTAREGSSPPLLGGRRRRRRTLKKSDVQYTLFYIHSCIK